MLAILQRELKAYFTGVTGYVFAAFMLLFVGIYAMALCLSGGYTNFEYVLGNVSFVFLICVPVLTMRVIAEDRRQKTDQLLYSLPIGTAKVVLGKYLAMLGVLLVPIIVTCAYPIILSSFGAINMPAAYGSIIAFFFLGAALISMGLFISSLTENQITSAVICLGALLLNYFITDLASFVSTGAYASLIAMAIAVAVVAAIYFLLTRNLTVAMAIAVIGIGALIGLYAMDSSKFSGLFPQVMEKLSVFDRFYEFINGVFDITALVYMASVAGLFVFFTVQSVEKRRWS